MTWLTPWLTNPWLLVGGAALVALPILIHLLNKRKFKIVDWAAMDFLLEADKKNRRRLQLENLILLLLRCLAVLLLGLLLARPFACSQLTPRLLDTVRFERYVVLDDSLSMQARNTSQSAFEDAKQRLLEMVRALPEEQNDNALTLLLTSRPDQPVLHGAPVTADTLGDIVAQIEAAQPSDQPAHWDAALLELEKQLAEEARNVNRVVYLVTDLRRRDWLHEALSAGENHPVKVLRRMAREVNGCFVVDVADEGQQNLIVADIRPEETLVAGVSSRFDVAIANPNPTEARDVTVKFTVGASLPLVAEVERVPPGGSTTVPFTYTFTAPEGEVADKRDVLQSLEVRAELSVADPDRDRLPADSLAFFPARVVGGVPTLVLDGDPQAAFGRSESTYLLRALSPPGQAFSGVAVEEVNETEFDAIDLSKFQVVFLCNVHQLPDERVRALESWTRAGGALVLMPGDQVDENAFNRQFHRDGAGLSPFRLEGWRGDETQEKWVFFEIVDRNHDVLRVFTVQDNLFLDRVKTFRWWGASLKSAAPTSGRQPDDAAPRVRPASLSQADAAGETDPSADEQRSSEVRVAARFTDADHSLAMAEKQFGAGRVFATAFPADADWSTWPNDPSYLIAMQELVRYLTAGKGGGGAVRVGQPLVQSLDLTEYQLDAELRTPGQIKVNLQATPPGETGDNAQDEAPTDQAGSDQPGRDQPGRDKTGRDKTGRDKTGRDSAQPDSAAPSGAARNFWQVIHPAAEARGFYEMRLTRKNQQVDKVLFAANVDPQEGDLRKLEANEFRQSLGDAPVRLVVGGGAMQEISGSQRELWVYVLLALAGVLLLEQVLGLIFGLRR